MAAWMVAWPSVVFAHHVVSDYGIAPVEPRSVIEIDAQVAHFSLGDRSGTWFVVAPSFEYLLIPQLSFTARVPLALVDYADGNTVLGVGDIDLGGKVRVFATAHGGFIASLGLSAGFPTGSSTNGIGSGHFELSPFAAISSQPTNHLVLHGILADRLSLGGAEHHDAGGEPVHGSVIAPHSGHELFARIGASLVWEPVFVSAGTDIIYVVEGHDPRVPVTVRAEIGFLPRDRLRVSVGFDVPVAGEHRFSWRVRTGIAWLF